MLRSEGDASGRLPNHLREMREERRLTREAAATLVRVSDRSLARYESGERVPPYSLVVLLALLYRCKVSDLMPGWANDMLDMVAVEGKWQDWLALCRSLSADSFEVLTRVAEALRAKDLASNPGGRNSK